MDDPVLNYGILETLHAGEGRVTQRHISEKLGRSVASVNFALRLLAAKGFIKISGSNPKSLRYHLTPRGVLQKSVLAYNFLKRQAALYEEVRSGLLRKLQVLVEQGVKKVSLYGWTPFTESAILYLTYDGIEPAAIYVDRFDGFTQWNRIPLRSIHEFQADCEVLVLMEPLPAGLAGKLDTKTLVCYPSP